DPHYHESGNFSSSTSTGVLRRHLYECHLESWVSGCDQLKIPITAKEAIPFVARCRGGNGDGPIPSAAPRPEFSQEAFIDGLVNFIVSDDQSVNVIENEHLRKVFLLLRKELRDTDIPHRTHIRKRIAEIWDEH
ncbi:hypothetical protein GGX14DRAFT_332480, partial [Mycena pura]